MTYSKPRPLALIILDGTADNPNPEANAVLSANTPTLDRLRSECPTNHLDTFGKRVGLLDGQMGNSEVGHLNIGAGRVVKQELTIITEAVEDGSIGDIPELQNICAAVARSSDAALHLIGLVSTGGVHSHLNHAAALVAKAAEQGVSRIFVHAITDGRDRPPAVAADELAQLEQELEKIRKAHPEVEAKIVSVIGRYYAMDRDTRWERTTLAYNLFTQAKGEVAEDPIRAIRAQYEAEETDEFLKPISIDPTLFSRTPSIVDGDTLLFFNFRADRMRQITRAFLANQTTEADTEFNSFERTARPKLSQIATLTEYDATYPVDVLFRPRHVKNHLGEVAAGHNLVQVRIAETEKYPHVTYFFNGGVEAPSDKEERILIPSPRDVPTYDLKPEMSAEKVTDALLDRLNEGDVDLVVLNFANCDMVGHTGVLEAAISAVETVDGCLGRILEKLESLGGAAIVTADHGNADQMIDYETGEPHTFHTTHPVPIFLVGKQYQGCTLRDAGALCDIAPTICDLLEIEQPSEMTGKSLLMR